MAESLVHVDVKRESKRSGIGVDPEGLTIISSACFIIVLFLANPQPLALFSYEVPENVRGVKLDFGNH